LLKWRLRKLLFDAKIQFLAKEKRESTTKIAIFANRCYLLAFLQLIFSEI
jgi:hypothetical protein